MNERHTASDQLEVAGDLHTWVTRVEARLGGRRFKLIAQEIGPIDSGDGEEVEAHQFLYHGQRGLLLTVMGAVTVTVTPLAARAVRLQIGVSMTGTNGGAALLVRNPARRLLDLVEAQLLDPA